MCVWHRVFFFWGGGGGWLDYWVVTYKEAGYHSANSASVLIFTHDTSSFVGDVGTNMKDTLKSGLDPERCDKVTGVTSGYDGHSGDALVMHDYYYLFFYHSAIECQNGSLSKPFHDSTCAGRGATVRRITKVNRLSLGLDHRRG